MIAVTHADVATFARCPDTRDTWRCQAQAALAGHDAVAARQVAACDAISLCARVHLLCHVAATRDPARAPGLATALLAGVPQAPDDVRVAWPTHELWDQHWDEARACAARQPLRGVDLARVVHVGALLHAYLVSHQRDSVVRVVRSTAQRKFLRDALTLIVTHLETTP